MDFPSSPTVGQSYSFSGRTWIWNGTGWARSQSGGGAWYEIEDYVFELFEATGSEPGTWYEVTYV